MKHKVKVTVLDKKLYPELQQQYLADPESGACPCYNVGDEFIFLRDEGKDDYWHLGLKTLVKTNGDPDTVAGGPKMPFCSEDLSTYHDLQVFHIFPLKYLNSYLSSLYAY